MICTNIRFSSPDKLLLSLLLFALSHLYQICRRRPTGGHFANVVKCVTLGNVTKFFLLPSVIWQSNITEAGIQLHELLVGLYYIIALLQTFSGLYTK